MDISNLVESPLNPQQKPYWQVLHEHQQAVHDYPALAGTSVHEFAENMGPGYEAGLGADNALRRGSGNIDVALHHFGGGAPGYTGPTLSGTLGGPPEGIDLPKLIGGAVQSGAQKVGASPETAEKLGQVGAGIPRMAVDIGAGAALGGIPGVAAASALSTYGETGSKVQAGISGLTAGLMPAASAKLGTLALEKLGAPTIAKFAPDLLQKATALGQDTTKLAGQLVPENWGQGLAKIAAGQVGMFGVSELGEAAQNIAGEGTTDQKLQRLGEQFSPSSLIATGFSQLPWAVHDLVTRERPLKTLQQNVLEPAKAEFTQKFSTEYRNLTNQEATPELIKSTIDRVTSGKPPQNEQVGQVLASIGSQPVQTDLKRPVRTNEGEWQMLDAIQSVKDGANQIVTARPELGIDRIGDAHDDRIYSALRAVEAGSEGKLSKDEMSRQAASRVVDTMTRDNADLAQISLSYAKLNQDELKNYSTQVEKNSRDVEIANKVMPDNPLYDQQTHQRIALLTGKAVEQQASGITPRTEVGQPTQPIRLSTATGTPLEIKDNLMSQIERDLNKGVDPTTGQRKQVVLTADATAAGRRAAADYPGNVDINDPQSVGKFYNYVKLAVSREQTGWTRSRGEEPSVRDAAGKVINHATEAQAELAANRLNETKEEGERFEPRKNPNGTYRVVQAKYNRFLSTSPAEAGKPETGNLEAGQGPIDWEGVKEAYEEGIPKTTLDQFGEDLRAQERNQILEQFHALNRQRDPAIREARKAALVQNVIDYVKNMPDSALSSILYPDGIKRVSLQQFAERKAVFAKMMQFIRDGGDLNFKTTKTNGGRIKIKGEGNLDALNRYLGEHGFANASSLSRSVMGGLNVFEQFHVLTKALAKEFINPDKLVDFTQRPRGDFAWMPPGFKDDVEKNLLVKWPKEYSKAILRRSSEWMSVPDEEWNKNNIVLMKTRDDSTRRFEAELNPLATAFVKGTKHELTMSAGTLADMFQRFAPNADKTLLEIVKKLTDQPFGKQINVGFGIAKDSDTKGYYHHGDDLVSGTGILLSPFSEAGTGRHIRSLDRPEEVLPHLVHELAHAHTVYGYYNDPTVKAEVDRIHSFLKDRQDGLTAIGAEGKFTTSALHGLDSPMELLATVFHDPLMQEYLKGIKDTLGPLPKSSMWDKLMDVFRRIFAKIVGEDGAGTILQRVSDVTQLAMRANEVKRQELGITHSGDIYGAAVKGGKTIGDLIMSQKPQAVPKPGETKPTYPWADNPDAARAQLNEAQTRRQEAERALTQFTSEADQYSGEEAKTHLDRLEQELKDAKVQEEQTKALVSRLTAGKVLESKELDTRQEGGSKDFVDISDEKDKYGKYGTAPVLIDGEGRMFTAKGATAHYDVWDESPKGKNNFVDAGFIQPDGRIRLGSDYFGASEEGKYITSGDEVDYVRGAKGEVLESRVNSQPIVDSMKAASEYATEDDKGQWFKPISMQHFRDSFGPVMGDRMKPEQQGEQWGFRTSPVAFSNITEADLALAPKPQIKPWAPSAFEMMRSLFVKNGETPENAEALAGYNLQMASLLKGSEGTIWGQVNRADQKYKGELYRLAGVAMMPEKVGGITQFGASRSGIERTLRHEQTHLAGFTDANTQLPSDVRDSIRYTNSLFADLSQDERDTVINGLVKLTNQTGGISDIYQISRTNPHEFASEFMSHVGQGLGNTSAPNAYIRDLARFAPDDLSTLLIKTTLRRAQALDGLRQTTTEAALQRGIKPEVAVGIVDDLVRTFKEMGRETMDIALDQAEFYRMRNLYPDMYQQMLKASSNVLQNVNRPGYALESRVTPLVKDVRKFFGLADDNGKLPDKPSWWLRNLTQFAQFTNQFPIARPFYDMLRTARGLERQRQIQLQVALSPATEGRDLIDKGGAKRIVNLVQSPRLRDILSNIALDMQTTGDAKFKQALAKANGDVMQLGPVDVATPEFMDAAYKKYGATTKEREILDTAFQGIRNQITLSSANIVDSHMTAVNTVAASAIAKATNRSPEQARKIAQSVLDAVKAQDSGDFQTALQKEQEFTQGIANPDVAERIYGMVNDSWQDVRRLERFLSVRMPYFMSERRFGDFGLYWKNDAGKVVSHYFKNGTDRNNFIQAQKIDPLRQTNPGDKNFGVSDQLFEQLDTIQNKLKDRLIAVFGEQKAGEISQIMDASSELRTALQARDVLKLTAPRKGAEGRQYLDMFDTHQNYVNAVVSSAKNRQMRLEAQLLLSTPEFDNQPVMKDLLNTHLNSMLTPDTPTGRAITNVVFLNYLAGNISSIMLQSSHQLTGLAPMLTARGATVAGSYKTILKANKMFIDSRLNGKEYTDPEIKEMTNRARREGVIDLGNLSEIDHDQDLQMINRIRAGSGQGLYTPFEMLKNRMYQASNLLRKFYGIVPAYNSEIGFVASLLHLKSQGYTGENLYSEAAFLKDNTMFGGGKLNRPIGLFDVLPRSAAQSVWSLQTYTNGLTTMMGNFIKKSLNPKGLTPAQTAQTRKAAVQMLSTQIALAGTLGLPFAETLLYGLQKLFPDHNIEQMVRDALGQLGGDDDALGGWLSSALTTGIPSSMDEAPDLGSRFALAGAMEVSPYSGVGLESLTGPAGGIVSKVFHAAQAGQRGDAIQTVQNLMPVGFARIWQGLEQGHSFISPSGNVMANDLSPIEQFARTIGFTPARVARIRTAQRLAKESEDAATSEQRQFVDKVSDKVIAGNDSEAHQDIVNRALESKGIVRPEELARATARRVEEKTMPVDPRSFGNKQTVESQRSLKGVLGGQTAAPSNTDRIKLQQSIAQRLGIPKASPTLGGLRNAAGLDNLLQMYPSLTKPQAAVLLNHATASQPIAQELLAGVE